MGRKHTTRRRLSPGFVTCGLVAIYFIFSVCFALYNWREFASATPQLVRYVIVPGAIALAFLLIGQFARPSRSLTFGVYGLSALAALFLFEGYLVYKKVPVIMGMLGQLNADQREELASDKDRVRGFTLRSLNVLAGTKTLSNSILSGFPHADVILCAQGETLIRYTADRYGFNNPDGIYDEAKPSMMVLGDSFAEGFCLEPGKDLASRLRDDGLDAVTFGIRGNGPMLELATLGRFGPIIRPQHVVMAFFEGNDWENLQKELEDPWLRAALGPTADFGAVETGAVAAGAALAKHRDQLNAREVTFADLFLRRETLRNFVALQQTGTLLGLIYPKVPREMPEFREIIARAKTLTQSWGGEFSIVYIPQVDRFLGALPVDGAFDQLRDKVLADAAAVGIDVIDLREAMRAHPDPKSLYGPDSHFDEDGAEFAARVIARRFESEADGAQPSPQVVDVQANTEAAATVN